MHNDDPRSPLAKTVIIYI